MRVSYRLNLSTFDTFTEFFSEISHKKAPAAVHTRQAHRKTILDHTADLDVILAGAVLLFDQHRIHDTVLDIIISNNA